MATSFGLIEISLVFAIALALLGYELHAVRKSIREDARNGPNPPPNAARESLGRD
ncbi:MAG: hypothetical protein ACT4OU_01310 [Hyphomicrobium sp.]